jgi:hypothetical protein
MSARGALVRMPVLDLLTISDGLTLLSSSVSSPMKLPYLRH